MDHRITADDMIKATELMTDIKKGADGLTEHIRSITEKVKTGEIHTDKGISFLEVKYQMLLKYLINLSWVMCQKTRGKSMKDEPAVERLAEIRTVLEKMRPIDQKLKYQIDKTLKSLTMGGIEGDPLRLKPNPANLESKLDDESGSDSGDEDGSKVYKPPKMVAMHYDGDLTKEELEEQELQKKKKRALSRSFLHELKREYSEAPEEISGRSDDYSAKREAHMKEEYEEENFRRVAVSKKDKRKERQIDTVNSAAGDILNFGNISALTGEDDDDDIPAKKRKRSSKDKGKKGKGKSKFKRRK